MISKYIDLIIAPLFKKILLGIQESFLGIFISVSALAIFLVIIIAFSKWIEFGNIFLLLSGIFSVMLLFSLRFYIYLLWLTIVLVFGIIIYLLRERRRAKIIEVKIKRNSKSEDYFVVPPDADWSLIPDDDTLGNVLSVTSSGLTGHLIKGNEWCNYRLTFKAKIIYDNFTFAIRAIDKNNCIFFQCGKKNICPHLIISGIAIRHFKDLSLPVEIPEGKWIDVSVLVKGKNVAIKIMGIEREFDIPHGPWFIEKAKLALTLEYDDVEVATKKAIITDNITDNFARAIAKEEEIEEIVRNISLETIKKIKLETYHVFNFDYSRGTIGFRESDKEHALFKDIKVELLDRL